jgi:hypothetical protein
MCDVVRMYVYMYIGSEEHHILKTRRHVQLQEAYKHTHTHRYTSLPYTYTHPYTRSQHKQHTMSTPRN